MRAALPVRLLPDEIEAHPLSPSLCCRRRMGPSISGIQGKRVRHVRYTISQHYDTASRQRWSACSLQRFASDKWIPCRLVA